MTQPDREQLLDELARCFMRAAVDRLLEELRTEVLQDPASPTAEAASATS
jgi:hypothetical protein